MAKSVESACLRAAFKALNGLWSRRESLYAARVDVQYGEPDSQKLVILSRSDNSSVKEVSLDYTWYYSRRDLNRLDRVIRHFNREG